jgi:hypothetical protein
MSVRLPNIALWVPAQSRGIRFGEITPAARFEVARPKNGRRRLKNST